MTSLLPQQETEIYQAERLERDITPIRMRPRSPPVTHIDGKDLYEWPHSGHITWLIISDKRLTFDCFATMFKPTVVNVSYHEMMTGDFLRSDRWQGYLRDAKAVWFDLPEGQNFATTKMKTLDNVLHSLVGECAKRKLACMTILPFVRGSQHYRPHRWQKLLKTWGKPQSVTFCMCKFVSKAEHLKIRMFATHTTLVECLCKHPPDANLAFAGKVATSFLHGIFPVS